MKHITILGGGISGLSTAWFLRRLLQNQPNSAVCIRVMEQAERVGGWLQTETQSNFQFEVGTRSMSPKPKNAQAVWTLVEGVGLQPPEVLTLHKLSSVSQQKHLVFGGEVRAVPSPFQEMGLLLRHPLTRSILPALLRDVVVARRRPLQEKDESIQGFFTRRFHKDVADRLMSAFVNGVYAGDISEWSMRAQFPVLWELERKYRSILIGYMVDAVVSRLQQHQGLSSRNPEERSNSFDDLDAWKRNGSMYSFQEGMEALPQALVKDLRQPLEGAPEVQVELGRMCVKMEPKADQTIELSFKDAPRIHSHLVISALPAYALSPLLKTTAPTPSGLISQLEFKDVAPVSLAWRHKTLKQLGVEMKPSVGYLCPHHEHLPELGMIMESLVFPQRQPPGSTVMTVMLGPTAVASAAAAGGSREHVEKRLEEIAIGVLKQRVHLNPQVKPDCIHARVCKRALPQYKVGHVEWVNRVEAEVQHAFKDRLVLTGASFRGIGVPDCILQAEKTAKKVLNMLNQDGIVGVQ